MIISSFFCTVQRLLSSNVERTRPGSKVKIPVRSISMKFCPFNQEFNGQGLGHIRDQRSLWSKINNGCIAPRWKGKITGSTSTSK